MRDIESLPDLSRVFRSQRVDRPEDIPPVDERILDVAILDMNHNWPNLGHDALVRAVAEIAQDLSPLLEATGLCIRVLSYDVRRSLMIPSPLGDRYLIYLGTGGPGHIDPSQNDGLSEGTQGIAEDASWEKPLFRLFEAIHRNQDAAFLAVCHTFGVLCRWSGVARPVLRGPEKGGKSSGVRENVLTAEALRHPWFSQFAARLPDGRHLRIVDSRLFDLIPISKTFPEGVIPLARETRYPGGPEGDALTMLEFATDRGGVMPRILAVNHHPEIRDRRRQRRLLEEKFARGEVSMEWYEERARTLDQVDASRESEHQVLLTSQYTLLAPLRFHLYRQVRLRTKALGFKEHIHEDQVLRYPSGTLDREENL